MILPDAAEKHRTSQALLSLVVSRGASRIWQQMQQGDFDVSWRTVGPLLLTWLTASKARAAKDAQTYVGSACEEVGINPSAVGSLVIAAFSGRSSRGEELGNLLYQPVIRTRFALSKDVPLDEALAQGENLLTSIVTTEVADTGRSAELTSMVARPAVTGWVRMTEGTPCSRCILLAGKTYRFSDGFARHPMCGCKHIPAAEDVAGDLRTDPTAYFESLSKQEQNKTFGGKAAEALRNGDKTMSQVLNYSGMDFSTPRRTGPQKKAIRRSRRRGTNTAEDLVQATQSRSEARDLLLKQGFLAPNT